MAEDTDRALELKRKELASSRWSNPLVVAIMAATVVALGNLVVAWFNGDLQRDLEKQRSEQTRILEMIKTGNDPDKAAVNLRFLLDAGLVSDPDLIARLDKFLVGRKPGSGPTLPTVSGVRDLQRPPMIAGATVDADRRTMVVSGWGFGRRSTVVTLGNRVLKVKSQSNSELLVEFPTDISPGSYRLMITVMEPSKLSSEPFSVTIFAAR